MPPRTHLMKRAGPEQRLTLPAHVAGLVIQRRRPFQQHKLVWVFAAFGQEPGVHDPAAGQRQHSLRAIQDPVRGPERTIGAAKDSLLIKQPGPLKWFHLVGHLREYRLPDASYR